MLSRLATRQRLLVAAPKMCRLTLVARPITPTQMVQKRQLSVVQWLRGEPLLEQGKFFFVKKGKEGSLIFYNLFNSHAIGIRNFSAFSNIFYQIFVVNIPYYGFRRYNILITILSVI